MVSMMGMSVCAAGGVTGGTEDSPITSVPVNKTVSAAENTYAPNTTFNFKVSTGDTNPSNWDGKEVKQGILGGLKVKQGGNIRTGYNCKYKNNVLYNSGKRSIIRDGCY